MAVKGTGKNNKKLVTRVFLVAMAVLAVFTAADVGRQVYRLNNVEITMGDGSVRAYKMVSSMWASPVLNNGEWVYVFEQKDVGTGVAPDVVSIKYNRNRGTGFESFSPDAETFSERIQWREKTYIASSPWYVLLTDGLMIAFVGVSWLTMKIYSRLINRMNEGGPRERIERSALLGSPMMGAISYNAMKRDKENWEKGN